MHVLMPWKIIYTVTVKLQKQSPMNRYVGIMKAFGLLDLLRRLVKCLRQCGYDREVNARPKRGEESRECCQCYNEPFVPLRENRVRRLRLMVLSIDIHWVVCVLLVLFGIRLVLRGGRGKSNHISLIRWSG